MAIPNCLPTCGRQVRFVMVKLGTWKTQLFIQIHCKTFE
jgi:hypothetical protein